ncbi:hypothetical protein 2 [Beihai picorna-like virus 84]|uniref:hypothetical protein 2 n=1 Tax=Beihai picorna-like virus 84 TaxID=1922632 RepID=UPI00090C9D69|nr:hypothetical protein 2 [Beihai picorna-like virus 84]APG76880.1 hypothetical protein 2 [Beihai picorna-like virus 84]
MTDVQAPAEGPPMADQAKAMALNDLTNHQLLDIIQRPVRIDTFEISSADIPIGPTYRYALYDAGVSSELKSYSFPSDILSDAAPIVDKLSNFKYLRCDIEVEIKFNTNPFQQGIYMIAYTPLENETNKLRSTGPQGFAQLTSFPHKFVNLAVENSAKMTLPYLNERDYLDLTQDPLGELGALRVYCVVRLGGPTSAERAVASVFASLKNVDVKVPCGVGSLAPYRQKAIEREISLLQERRRKRKQMIGEADTGDEPNATGPVTKIADTVGKIADVVEDIPVIGGIAKTVGWVARGVHKVASLFGWSKPIHAVIATDVLQRPGYSLLHGEGKDHSIALGMIPDNCLLDTGVIPAREDEMAIAFVAKQPNMVQRYLASATDFVSGKLLFSLPVTPVQPNLMDDTEGETWFQGSLGYMSLMYQYWRGELIFDVWCAKTAFHSGRFVAVFQPEIIHPDEVPATLGQQLSTNYTKVCDLNPADGLDTGSRWRVRIPYVSNEPWKNTRPTSFEDGSLFDGSTTTGFLSFYALNELVAPETVEQNVTFVIMLSGGSDFELGFPMQQFRVGYADDPDALPMRGESLEERGDCVQDPGDIVMAVKSDDVCPSTTGEYSKSLRALIKRNELWATAKPGSTLRFSPMQSWLDARGRVAAPSNAPAYTGFYDTCMYQVSCLYRMYTGSSRVKINRCAQGGGVKAALVRTNARDPQSFSRISPAQKPTVFLDGKLNNLLELTIPFYSRLRARVLGPLKFSGVIPGVEVNDYGTPTAELDNGTTTSTLTDVETDMELYISGGDDLSFFFLVGPPPIHLLPA